MTIQRVRLFASRHQRTLIITAGISVALLAGIYTFWSANTWAGQKTSYQIWQNELHTSIDTALKLPATSTTERSKKLDALKTISKNIDISKGSLCAVNATISWQQVIATLKSQEAACNKIVENAIAFNTKLRKTIEYLDNDQALAKIMAPLSAPTNVTEADFNSVVTKWQSALIAIKQLATIDTFTSVKSTAVDKVQAVTTAWQMVEAAHKEQNKAKYTAAMAQLAQSYDGLTAITSLGAQQIATLTKEVQVAYTVAFD